MDTQWLANINLPSIYIALSAGGGTVNLDRGALKKTEGKLPKSKFFQVSSVVDTLWLFVSIAVVYLLDFKSIEMTVPVAYWIYALSGWVYGSRLLKRSGLPASPEELIIPKPYIAFSQSFSTTFFALCVFVLLFSKPIS